MPFKKVCKTCNKEFLYETQEEILKYFYQKSGYLRGTCKECEKEEHKNKYKSGKYNYRNDSYEPRYSFGTMGGE